MTCPAGRCAPGPPSDASDPGQGCLWGSWFLHPDPVGVTKRGRSSPSVSTESKKFGSLRGNSPRDRSLGRAGRGQPREVGRNGVSEARGLARDVQVPCPARTEGPKQERSAPGPGKSSHARPRQAAQPCGTPLSWLPAPSPRPSVAQRAPAEEKANPTDLLASSCSRLYPPARALGARRAPWASRAWPPALACRELTQETSGQRVSAQWREVPFISILLLFEVHTPALFTTK